MRIRVAGLCGVIGPIVSLSMVLLAVANSPWFNWTRNALSDLGVRGFSSLLFNSGLVIGGTLMTVFALGLVEVMKGSVLGRLGAFILVLDGAFLTAIGIFPETFGAVHLYVSAAFFALIPPSLIPLGVAMVGNPPGKMLGLLAFLAAVVAMAVWFFPWNGVAIPETISSLAASSWSIPAGLRVYRRGMILD